MKKGEAFNVEKEHKIINPHHMEMETTNQKNFTGKPSEMHKKH